jgi:beta-lactamase regulating signal transducer with metallopeptidase domain
MIGPGALLDPAAGAGLVVRTTVLIICAGLAARALQAGGRSAACRYLVWLATIGALLVLPLVWAFLPALRIAWLPALGASATHAVGSGGAQENLAWVGGALAVYGSGVVVLLARVCAARWALGRLWRAAVPCGGQDWANALADAQGRMAGTATVALRFSPMNCTPMTWGLLSPRILLPADARTWGREHRRMVLMHELAHVSRHDSAARLAASLACAIHWIHPGAWLAASRLRVEQERAADDLVLSAGAVPRNYARTLLEFASRRGLAGTGLHAAAMAGRSELEARLASIVGAGRRNPPSRRFAVVAAVVAAGTTLLIAVMTPVRAQLSTDNLVSRPMAQAPRAAESRPAGRIQAPAVHESRRAVHRPRVAAATGGGDAPGTRLAATPPVPPLRAVAPTPAVPATPPTPPTPARLATPAVPPHARSLRP